LNYLNGIFKGWAEENIDEETDPLFSPDSTSYGYTTFLNASRSDDVIAAWKEAL